MAISLGRALGYLYPDGDFEVRLDGSGEEYIAVWNVDAPEPTAQEIDEVKLEAAKAQKMQEFARLALDDLAPLFTTDRGEQELQAIHNTTLIDICQALDIPVDPRIAQVDTVQQKAFQKKSVIEAAQSVSEVDAISWE